MPRGRLRVYLGVGPGAGTTRALLDEAARRRARGADVVLGAVTTRGRPDLVALADGLEATGPQVRDGGPPDVPALLRRRPGLVVLDDLGTPDPHPRWHDAEELLDAGIDVLAGLDVRSVASLAAAVEELTGAPPPGTVPDRVLQPADVQLVDITPRALRRRLAHGRLHRPDELDAATSARYRPHVLARLRELALVWAAGTVPASDAAWAGAQREGGPSAARPGERLLVALSGGPESEQLLHHAARLATRMPGAELLAVHVIAPSGVAAGGLRELAATVGAAYHEVIGDDIAAALLAVAASEHATRLVVGGDAVDVRPRLLRRLTGVPGTAGRLVAAAADVDILVVGRAAGRAGTVPPRRPGLPGWRLALGFALAVTLPGLAAVALEAAGSWIGLAGQSLALLLAVVVTSLVGGWWPALLAAVVGSTLLNYFFIPPVHTLRVAEPHNVTTLVVFVLVAALVGAVVQRAAALSAEAARASAESRALSALATGVLQGTEALPSLLEHVRSAFGMTSVSLLERRGADWGVVADHGPAPAGRPADADVSVPAGHDLVLALSGRTLAATDRRLLRAFAAQAEGLLERDRLARAAATAARLEATERLRDALLAAVGHDLRTPLAAATAAVSSLRADDVDFSAAERAELLATADESLDRLARLVADLLDLSRLRAGVLRVETGPVWLDDLTAPALDELGPAGADVVVRLPDDLPPVLADPALLTRAVVNLLTNAVRHSPPGTPPLLTAGRARGAGDRVEIRVVDRGPGIPDADRERVFTPFQRLGDTDNRTGLGLGLALSRGLVEAMDGTLEPDDTPGGGLTMVLSLPAADADVVAAAPGRRERSQA